MTVCAASLQLITQGGLVQQDINQNCKYDGDQDAAVDLGAGEDLIQAELRCFYAVKGGLIDISALSVLHHILKGAHIERPGNDIGRQPVGHNAGQNFVDVQKCLQHTGNCAPQSAGQHTAHKSNDPNQPGGHHAGGNTQSQHQGGQCAHQVLTGCADVEKACLEGNRHGKTGHNNRGCTEKHIAQALRIIAPSKDTVLTAGIENTCKNQLYAISDTLHGHTLGKTHDHDHNGTNGKTDQDGKQRCQQLFSAIFLIEIQQSVFHSSASPFLSRFAPAI